MSDRPDPRTNATAFREVVSQWQLAARTEVKRSSSLPSSMFDACDPMLEAQLAESVEAMMNCLHEPGPDVQPAEPQNLELRTERVDADELRRLPQQIARLDGDVDVEADTRGEYLSLLVDACVTGDDAARAAARVLLRRDFGLEGDLTDAAARLQQQLGELLPGDEQAADDAVLTDLCQRVAAEVLVRLPEADA